jgi:hypothetical protein
VWKTSIRGTEERREKREEKKIMKILEAKKKE